MRQPDPTERKRQLRRELRAQSPAAPDASGPIRTAILAWLAGLTGIRTVATFAALPGEPDLLPLLAARPDLRWCLPRVDGPLLHLHRVISPSQLVPGRFGVREPTPDLTEFPAGAVDLFLCPGLAFAPCGTRLGRGAGYYDRLLAMARPGSRFCGVVFRHRILPEIPAEPHDATMHFLASSGGVIACA